MDSNSVPIDLIPCDMDLVLAEAYHWESYEDATSCSKTILYLDTTTKFVDN